MPTHQKLMRRTAQDCCCRALQPPFGRHPASYLFSLTCLFRCPTGAGQVRHHLRGGPDPRDLHGRPALQAGLQLPVARQAVRSAWRVPALNPSCTCILAHTLYPRVTCATNRGASIKPQHICHVCPASAWHAWSTALMSQLQNLCRRLLMQWQLRLI